MRPLPKVLRIHLLELILQCNAFLNCGIRRSSVMICESMATMPIHGFG